ncbi:hypothetical protein Hanom_Chr11g01019971 [Helianthus anomalus]
MISGDSRRSRRLSRQWRWWFCSAKHPPDSLTSGEGVTATERRGRGRRKRKRENGERGGVGDEGSGKRGPPSAAEKLRWTGNSGSFVRSDKSLRMMVVVVVNTTAGDEGGGGVSGLGLGTGCCSGHILGVFGLVSGQSSFGSDFIWVLGAARVSAQTTRSTKSTAQRGRLTRSNRVNSVKPGQLGQLSQRKRRERLGKDF